MLGLVQCVKQASNYIYGHHSPVPSGLLAYLQTVTKSQYLLQTYTFCNNHKVSDFSRVLIMNATNTTLIDNSFTFVTHPLFAVSMLIALFGLFGNGLIVTASWVVKTDRLKSKSNHLIAMLAACDCVSNVGVIMVRRFECILYRSSALTFLHSPNPESHSFCPVCVADVHTRLCRLVLHATKYLPVVFECHLLFHIYRRCSIGRLGRRSALCDHDSNSV